MVTDEALLPFWLEDTYSNNAVSGSILKLLYRIGFLISGGMHSTVSKQKRTLLIPLQPTILATKKPDLTLIE